MLLKYARFRNQELKFIYPITDLQKSTFEVLNTSKDMDSEFETLKM